MPSKDGQFRFVCITDFRPQLQERGYERLPEQVQYIAWGHEICPDTHRDHLQVFAYGEKMTVKRWANLFGNSHVEPMMGSFRSNEKYCSKSSSLKELGVKPMHNGEKRCLVDMTDAILRDPIKPAVEIARVDPSYAPIYVQYSRGLEKLGTAALNHILKQKTHAPQVIHIWGPPGTGKSYYVRQVETVDDLYPVSPSDEFKWRDGYHGHPAVLFDNVETISSGNTARFLTDIDRYYVQVPTKGGFVGWRPDRIYITTLVSPEVFASQFKNPREYLRRVTSVMQMKDIYVAPVAIEN